MQHGVITLADAIRCFAGLDCRDVPGMKCMAFERKVQKFA
jgi:hypothetical protein